MILVFIQAYGKARKLAEGQNCKFLTISTVFTNDVIVCLSDQKWPGSSSSVIRGLNKSVMCDFIMGRLSLSVLAGPRGSSFIYNNEWDFFVIFTKL